MEKVPGNITRLLHEFRTAAGYRQSPERGPDDPWITTGELLADADPDFGPDAYSQRPAESDRPGAGRSAVLSAYSPPSLKYFGGEGEPIEPPVYMGEDGLVYATPEAVAYARQEAIGVPKAFKECTFSNFIDSSTDQHYYRAGALAWCKDLAEGQRQRTGLFITGPTGCGKTHIAVACAKKLCNKFSAHFVDFRLLADRCRSNDWRYNPVEDYQKSHGLLVIDEFACEETPLQVHSRITAILALRMDDGSPTILTSNLLYPEGFIGRRVGNRGPGCNFPLDERMQSRMGYGYHLMQCQGMADYRRLMS